MYGTMFETAEDRAVHHAYQVIAGNTLPGPKPTARQVALLRTIVECRGVDRAISIGRLAEREKTTPREIKSDIRDQRLVFRVRIGSSRREDGGFYLITTKEEALDTVRPFVLQAQAEFEIVRAILEPHEMKELEGQLRFSALPSAEDLDAVAEEARVRQATAGNHQEGTDAPLA